LPYSPLHVLLLREAGPLVLSSANNAGDAIIFEDSSAEAFYIEHNGDISGLLYHNRTILSPLEDSVCTVVGNDRIAVRLGRGAVPMSAAKIPGDILALGGDLKSSFCATGGGKAFLSGYFGNLESLEIFKRFKNSIESQLSLMRLKPQRVVCDAHPDYYSSHLAGDFSLPVIRVFHHHAHIAAVMAEHGLNEPLIGVAFDGTGYGEDGAVWGGEVFLYNASSFKCVGQLQYIRIVGGDEAAKNCAQAAVCHLIEHKLEVPERLLQNAATLYAAIKSGLGINCSSAGRLFDAVAAILGLCAYNTYEGQAATVLQQAAETALESGSAPSSISFEVVDDGEMIKINPREILKSALFCKDEEKNGFALGFHLALSKAVKAVCAALRKKAAVNKVILGGGVFQNTLLLKLCVEELTNSGFMVFYSKNIPANDSCIAVGQAYIAAVLKGTK
jgi:hydrogenase maturation protein HypF